MKKDEVLDKGLKLLEDVAKPVEVSRGRVCSFCGTSVKKRERSLRVEFRYDGSELRADVCEKCIDEREEIKAIHLEAPNPVFNVKVNCISADICESFKKPGKDRGINCGHIVANMDGELYCRKAHPGYLRIYRERHAFPPSRRQLMKMFKFLSPMFKKLKNGSLLAEEASAAQAVSAVLREVPDTLEYELKEFPIEENKVVLPWNAYGIKIGDQTVTAMVLVEKKEEEK
ncbi:hypothetical protein ES702_00540 [subsurface metagenome]